MEVFEELLQLARRTQSSQDAQLIEQAAFALMPPDIRLMERVSQHVEEAALVADVVASLGLRESQSVIVGKTLARLGFRKVMTRFDSRVYPLWIRNAKHPKAVLATILVRCEARKNAKAGVGIGGGG